MISFKMISGLFTLATYSAIVAAEYANDYDSGMSGYRSEPEPYQNRYDESQYDVPVSRSSHLSPSSDSNSFHLYHRDSQGVHDQPQQHQQDQPEHHHHEHPKHHHNHDHGTSSMSFYQKVKHHEHKFKFEQKHGKHGHFHGYSHPYAYGGLKMSDW